jgi:hypothetical protein
MNATEIFADTWQTVKLWLEKETIPFYTFYLNSGLFLCGCIYFIKHAGIVTVKRSRDDISTMEVF